MAVGSDIYVGRGRLRRRFRQQRIETRIKREEKRWKEREEKRKSRTLPEQSQDVRKPGQEDDRRRVDSNNNGETETPHCARHSCRFCDSFDTGDSDSLYSYSSSDSELVPLIEPEHPENIIKMPFKLPFKKKNEPKPEPVPVKDPEPMPQNEEKEIDQNSIETPLLEAESSDQVDVKEDMKENNDVAIADEKVEVEEAKALETENGVQNGEQEKTGEEQAQVEKESNPFDEKAEETQTETKVAIQEEVELENKTGTANGDYTAFSDDPEGKEKPFGMLCCTIM